MEGPRANHHRGQATAQQDNYNNDALAKAPFPKTQEELHTDYRVSFDKNNQKYVLEDEDQREWEWNDKISKWIPLLDEAEIEQQQQIYRVEGVNDDDEVNTAAEKNKKRKAEIKADTENKKAKNEPRERPNTAIYVTGIPLDAEFDEIVDKFKKFGIIEEDIHTGLPKVKLYADEHGNFKGDARIIYFKPQSVALAIAMLDGTDFRSTNNGNMRVQAADFSLSKNHHSQQKEVSVENIKKRRSKHDRAMAIRKTEEMNARLADWDDDDVSVVAPPPNPSKYNKLVVLKHMFTLKELEDEPALILEIKEDIRDEAAKFGTVTNTVLYDLEESGIVTVRFTDPQSAARTAEAFNGRSFGGQKVIAYVPQHKEQFSKSRTSGGDNDALQDIDEGEFDDEDKATNGAVEATASLSEEEEEEEEEDTA